MVAVDTFVHSFSCKHFLILEIHWHSLHGFSEYPGSHYDCTSLGENIGGFACERKRTFAISLTKGAKKEKWLRFECCNVKES